MIRKYLYIYKRLIKKDRKMYTFSTEGIILVLVSRISNYITPIFILLKIKPNFVTGINFIISIISIYFFLSLKNELILYGVIFYFIFRILDFTDGTVARYRSLSTFYGRFLDSILDIFYECFLFLSISFYIFSLFGEKNILIAGYILSIFAVFSTCIYDKYASLARWSNIENKTNILPYLKKNYFLINLSPFFNDVQQIFIFLLPLLIFNLNLLKISFYFFVSLMMIFYLQNIIKHIFFAKKNLTFQAKNKK